MYSPCLLEDYARYVQGESLHEAARERLAHEATPRPSRPRVTPGTRGLRLALVLLGEMLRCSEGETSDERGPNQSWSCHCF